MDEGMTKERGYTKPKGFKKEESLVVVANLAFKFHEGDEAGLDLGLGWGGGQGGSLSRGTV